MKMENGQPRHFETNYTILTLIITRRCPLNCPMCFFMCSPKRTERMDRTLAMKILDETIELGLTHVGITGGEPFLQGVLLEELIERAASAGVKPIVVTNAAWAVSESFAFARLKRLHALGLRWIQTSVDDQHQKKEGNYIPIPLERVGHLVNAATKLDYEDIKIMGTSQGNANNFKCYLFYLQEVLGVPLERVDILDRPRVSHGVFYDPGQARYSFQELEDFHKNHSPIPGMPESPACLTDLMVDVNGDLYPCCNNFVGRVGNVSTRGLRESLAELKNNSYYQMLAGPRNPFALARHLDETRGSSFCKGRYASWCELCARMFQDKFRELLFAYTHVAPVASSSGRS